MLILVGQHHASKLFKYYSPLHGRRSADLVDTHEPMWFHSISHIQMCKTDRTHSLC